jgi:hypothetical protein
MVQQSGTANLDWGIGCRAKSLKRRLGYFRGSSPSLSAMLTRYWRDGDLFVRNDAEVPI